MVNFAKSGLLGAVAMTALLTGAGSAAAEDDMISGAAGVSYNSHFISYGLDVWGGGNDFFDDRSTSFAWADFNIAAAEGFNINFGVWADINDNTVSGLGGNIQEIDWYVGGSYNFGGATLGVTYQEWNYASDEEKILDFALSIDDSEWWGGDFALAPKIVWHIRLDGNGGQADGSAIVVGVAPTFALSDTISLTIPAGVAFFLDEDFQGGTESGYGYSYVGGSLALPLSFIPTTYGAWTATADLTAYFTSEDAIPGNLEENFIVGALGVKVGF